MTTTRKKPGRPRKKPQINLKEKQDPDVEVSKPEEPSTEVEETSQGQAEEKVEGTSPVDAPKGFEEKEESEEPENDGNDEEAPVLLQNVLFDNVRGEFIPSTLAMIEGKPTPVVGSLFKCLYPKYGKLRVLNGSGPVVNGHRTLQKGDKPFPRHDITVI